MKITPELLKKYTAGECTEAERGLVEEWLPGDSDITATFSQEELSDATTQMWQNITQRAEMDNPGTVPASVIPIRRRLAYLAVAACLSIVIFGIGYFTETKKPTPAAHIASTSRAKGMLYVSSDPNSSIEVAANACEIILDGGVQLLNTSSFAREVTCNGKTFIIQPRRQYVIFSHTELGAHLLAPEAYFNDAELYQYLPSNTTFKVCV
ncbi:MAG: hypothetical protein ACFB15_31320 [Cyclobacteriaceae bacterium]